MSLLPEGITYDSDTELYTFKTYRHNEPTISSIANPSSSGTKPTTGRKRKSFMSRSRIGDSRVAVRCRTSRDALRCKTWKALTGYFGVYPSQEEEGKFGVYYIDKKTYDVVMLETPVYDTIQAAATAFDELNPGRLRNFPASKRAKHELAAAASQDTEFTHHSSSLSSSNFYASHIASMEILIAVLLRETTRSVEETREEEKRERAERIGSPLFALLRASDPDNFAPGTDLIVPPRLRNACISALNKVLLLGPIALRDEDLETKSFFVRGLLNQILRLMKRPRWKSPETSSKITLVNEIFYEKRERSLLTRSLRLAAQTLPTPASLIQEVFVPLLNRSDQECLDEAKGTKRLLEIYSRNSLKILAAQIVSETSWIGSSSVDVLNIASKWCREIVNESDGKQQTQGVFYGARIEYTLELVSLSSSFFSKSSIVKNNNNVGGLACLHRLKSSLARNQDEEDAVQQVNETSTTTTTATSSFIPRLTSLFQTHLREKREVHVLQDAFCLDVSSLMLDILDGLKQQKRRKEDTLLADAVFDAQSLRLFHRINPTLETSLNDLIELYHSVSNHEENKNKWIVLCKASIRLILGLQENDCPTVFRATAPPLSTVVEDYWRVAVVSLSRPGVLSSLKRDFIAISERFRQRFFSFEDVTNKKSKLTENLEDDESSSSDDEDYDDDVVERRRLWNRHVEIRKYLRSCFVNERCPRDQRNLTLVESCKDSLERNVIV